jgi:hypothetical protein
LRNAARLVDPLVEDIAVADQPDLEVVGRAVGRELQARSGPHERGGRRCSRVSTVVITRRPCVDAGSARRASAATRLPITAQDGEART